MGVLLFVQNVSWSEGIPEPPLTVYGVIRNTNGNANVRWNFGTLVWKYESVFSTNVLAVALTNINDQFSYLLTIPCEAPMPGFAVSQGTLRLESSPIGYRRTSVFVVTTDGITNSATLVTAPGIVTLTSRDRGRFERIDLDVSIPLIDSDNNYLPDEWERFYFANIFQDPMADPDHDGRNNFAESKAGTNPLDPDSLFRIIRTSPHPQGGTLVEWSSESLTTYAVQRSSNLTSGFTDIAVGIVGNGPMTSYHDATATGSGPFFYRLRLDRVYLAALDIDLNGLPDEWEVLYFGDRGVDPHGDPDGDSLSNAEEFAAGTNPIERNSALRFLNIQPAAQDKIAIEWSSVYQKSYTLLGSTSLLSGYSPIMQSIGATPPVNRLTNSIPPGGSKSFYRIRLDQ